MWCNGGPRIEWIGDGDDVGWFLAPGKGWGRSTLI